MNVAFMRLKCTVLVMTRYATSKYVLCGKSIDHCGKGIVPFIYQVIRYCFHLLSTILHILYLLAVLLEAHVFLGFLHWGLFKGRVHKREAEISLL